MGKVVMAVIVALAATAMVPTQAPAKKKQACWAIVLPGQSPVNCSVPPVNALPLANFAAGLNLRQVNTDMRRGGVPRDLRDALLSQWRGGVDARKIYDWAKAGKQNRIVSTLVPCLVGAVFGAIIGVLSALVTGNTGSLAFIGSGAVGGCLAEALKPAKDDIMRRVMERLKI